MQHGIIIRVLRKIPILVFGQCYDDFAVVMSAGHGVILIFVTSCIAVRGLGLLFSEGHDKSGQVTHHRVAFFN